MTPDTSRENITGLLHHCADALELVSGASALSREAHAVADALAARPDEARVAWEYELAQSLTEGCGYGSWTAPLCSHRKPNVPDGAIRNLRPLYATPRLAPQPPADVEAAIDRLIWHVDNSEYEAIDAARAALLALYRPAPTGDPDA